MRVFDINLKGLVMCSQYAARQMIAQGDGGAIINLSSSTGLNANVSRGPYSVSKAAVIMATNLLARELGEHNITVNALAPGFTSTAKIGGRDGRMFHRGEGETEKVMAKLALKREGEPTRLCQCGCLPGIGTRLLRNRCYHPRGWWLCHSLAHERSALHH